MRAARLQPWVAFAVVACLAILTACGNRGDGAGDSEREYRLSLAVYQGESRQGKQIGAVELTCEPTGGNHPHARQACDELAKVGGDFTKAARSDQACIMLYQPVTAVASGTWGNTRVGIEKTYGNSCELSASTGAILDFPVTN